MPAALNAFSSTPISYLVTLDRGEKTPVAIIEGPNAKSAPKDGDIQVMEEGIGVWNGRVRTLYPWHRIVEVREIF
jgi:hypothetical protein